MHERLRQLVVDPWKAEIAEIEEHGGESLEGEGFSVGNKV